MTERNGSSMHDQLAKIHVGNLQNVTTSLLLTLRFWGTVVIAYFVGCMMYNLYFHPLSRYPGPFWARASILWRIWHTTCGRSHRVFEACHRRYGEVFRVGPNELSFASVQAFVDIYTAKNPRILKNDFYDMLGVGFKEACLVTEKDHKRAIKKRALFTSALSERALMDQEVVIQRCVNAFIEKVGKLGSGAEGLDLTRWYMMLSFDIAGEMAFGETFGCVESENTGGWLDTISGFMQAVTIMDNVRRLPFALVLARLIPAELTSGLRSRLTSFAREKTRRRLEKSGDRPDFMSNVAEKVRSGKVSEEEMAAHCSIIAIAGSETSATSMATITFHLLKNQNAHERLKQEVRGRFKSMEEIDIKSAVELPYLRAVLDEGMRIVPTASGGFSRTSPGTTITGHYVPEGVEMYVSAWAVARDERNFREPRAYKPERWLDPSCTDVRAASQPFSLGPRSCPGKTFAYAQMSVQLAKMIWLYDVTLVDKSLDWAESVRLHFVLWKPELRVRLVDRKIV